MRTLFVIAGSLCLASVASAQTQTPTKAAPAKPTPKTAAKRAATYKGPKVVKDTKALGDKMIRESKPAPPFPVRVK
jgi:hypothetical protein